MEAGVSEGLAFPSSDPVPELEFRDGKRLVPPYLVPFLARIETHRMTYEEAVAIANQQMEADFINGRHADIIAAHFRDLG
jgi:hypothetical protein